MNKTDVSFRPRGSSHDVNPNYVPPASVNRPQKTTMELVWHNCETYRPEEEYNECLYLTNGDVVFEAEWDNGYWLFAGEKYVDDLRGLWWADIVQTVNNFTPITGAAKHLGLTMK